MGIKSVFLDGNIFIDINDNNRLTSKVSSQILNYLVSNHIKIYTSCDLITTVYYILSKQGKENALNSIEQINKICKIIELSNAEVLQTCQLMREDENFKDLEDTLQYVLAKNTNCDLIISNDKKFYSTDIELLTSNETIKKLNIKN